MEKAARELAVHISHPGPEYWKALGRLIGYLKGKDIKGVTVRKPKTLKVDMFCDSNYDTNKEIRKSVSSIVATL